MSGSSELSARKNIAYKEESKSIQKLRLSQYQVMLWSAAIKLSEHLSSWFNLKTKIECTCLISMIKTLAIGVVSRQHLYQNDYHVFKNFSKVKIKTVTISKKKKIKV